MKKQYKMKAQKELEDKKMREIIFRGKIKNSNNINNELNWAYGDKVTELSSGRVFIVDLSHFDENTKLLNVFIEVIPETIGQYTGLCGKNGKKIFEGDIVKIDEQYVRYVVYSGLYAGYCVMRFFDKLQSEICGYLGFGYDGYKHTIEVIGNIHDNPELLEDLK